MKISTLRQISKFIDSIIGSGYDGNTDIILLLVDMGFIAPLPDNLADILISAVCVDEHERDISCHRPISSHNTEMESAMRDMIVTTDIEKLITICDELCITQLTNFIVWLNKPLCRTMDNHIINYTSDYRDNTVASYNTGYKVLWDAKYVCTLYCCTNIDILENCIRNGLYIKNIHCDAESVHLVNAIPITDIEEIDINFWCTPMSTTTNDLIESNLSTIKSMKLRNNVTSYFEHNNFCHTICDIVARLPSLEFIEINQESRGMQYRKSDLLRVPHAIKSLSVMQYSPNGMLCDVFGKIKELRMTHCSVNSNDVIPNTVVRLCITYTNINDAMIFACTKIKYLHISGENSITTCAPFAKTLRRLLLKNTTMENAGLALCTNLKVLNADNNSKITTCAPFAKTLTKLYATNDCGIGDDGLKLCSKLKYLDASYNSKITTCDPFAKTLLYLVASCSEPPSYSYNSVYYMRNNIHMNNCGISDNGIKLCTKLISLYHIFNNRITLKLPIIYNE